MLYIYNTIQIVSLNPIKEALTIVTPVASLSDSKLKESQ